MGASAQSLGEALREHPAIAEVKLRPVPYALVSGGLRPERSVVSLAGVPFGADAAAAAIAGLCGTESEI